MSALGQKWSFVPGPPNGRFAPKAVIRLQPVERAQSKRKRRHDGGWKPLAFRHNL
jgi:hypothetical protein